MSETILFCVVFLGQLVFISWLYPRRFIARWREALRRHPPSTHPKLYTGEPGAFERWLRHIERLNLAVFITGLLILVGLVVATLDPQWNGRLVTPWSRSGNWSAAVVIPFYLLQVAASAGYMSIGIRKFLRSRAKAPPPRVRTSELRRRQLFDFVSPAMLIVAVVTNVAFIAFLLHYRQYGFAWFTAAGNIAGIVVAILALCKPAGLDSRRA